jgi:hypothetical protein
MKNPWRTLPPIPEEHREVVRELGKIWLKGNRGRDEARSVMRHIFTAFNGQARMWAMHRLGQLVGIEEQRALILAERSFSWVSYLLPSRLRNELVGDALEDIHRIINDHNCPNVYRAVRWKVISTCFFLLVNAVRNVSSAILGKKAE